MEVTDLTMESDPRCSFDSIPNEIVEYNIFGYFWFNYWIHHFASVCKRWKQICEYSTITPKHLRISPKCNMDIGKAILGVKKYQPTILDVSKFGHTDRGFNGYTIQELVGASEKIDTLIVDTDTVIRDNVRPFEALSRITTLVWRATFDERIFKVFPSLKRLQIHLYDDQKSKVKFPVEELTIVEANNVKLYLQNIEVPKLTIIKHDKVFKKINGIITELCMDDMTYEEYFRYFGKTKLFVMLWRHHSICFRLAIGPAANLLENSTSCEYEVDLTGSNFLSYKYPTRRSGKTNYDEFFMADYSKTHVHDVLSSNELLVSYDVRFVYSVNRGDVEAAVAILAKKGAKILVTQNSSKVVHAFFEMLSSPQLDANVFTDINVHEAATSIIREFSCYCNASLLLKTTKQFEKIVALYDWSKVTAVVGDYDLFWAMIEKGAQIPYKTFYDNLLHPDVTTITKILEKLITLEPSIWYDILSVSHISALKIMERFGISPYIEKNGNALWHEWLRTKFPSDDSALMPFVNHMDSGGSTLLITILNDLNEWNIERILQKGADPNKHQQGKLSPLATLLVKTALLSKGYTNLILLLFKFGADINQSCTFEGRQCSPLMIAVLVGSPLPTISLLIALGARTDYCDDQGRSIVDCVVECENKYEASDYRTLKWCLKG